MNYSEIDIEKIPCINCGKCLPCCPKRIGIPGSFAAMNYLLETSDLDGAKQIEKELVTDKGYKRAGECIVCGRCEKHCPMGIKIRDRLLDISNVLK
ncbi:MAG: 4Fe-4S dicluster domain-containing protein [Clostridia bacterium]|nr:4Fe-4S dicluster domain-containing protein [Clostridia bacterium]